MIFLLSCLLITSWAYSNDNPLVIPTLNTVNAFVADTFFQGRQGQTLFGKYWNTKFTSYCTESAFRPNSINGLDDYLISGRLIFSHDFELFEFNGVLMPDKSSTLNDVVESSLCIKTPSSEHPLYSDLMRPFTKKIVSFWFDLSVTEEFVRRNPLSHTGEIVFGGVNPARFTSENYVFTLNHLYEFGVDPIGWITKNPASVSVESYATQKTSTVVFDIGSEISILPIDMYNAVLGPVRSLVGDQTARKPNLPSEIASIINEYAGESPLQNIFPCSEAKNLKGFRINQMYVSTEMLVGKLNDRECILRVSPQKKSDQRDIVFGFHLIKNFHLQIHYNVLGESIAIFSKRKGKATCNSCCVIC